jgi:hypothetical protein
MERFMELSGSERVLQTSKNRRIRRKTDGLCRADVLVLAAAEDDERVLGVLHHGRESLGEDLLLAVAASTPSAARFAAAGVRAIALTLLLSAVDGVKAWGIRARRRSLDALLQ